MSIMSAEVRYAPGQPDRMLMLDKDMSAEEANWVALDATFHARQIMPRVTSRTVNRLLPISGDGWFGIYFPDPHVWFGEHGTKPFTMRSLAGKTIPMWVDDKDGSERQKNPKAKVRTTDDGRTQVLIFRKAARPGQRKQKRMPDGRVSSTPMSYPGAPGRIAGRSAGGGIASGNVGVRWRHPGLKSTGHLNQALSEAAISAGSPADVVYVCDATSWESVTTGKARGLI